MISGMIAAGATALGSGVGSSIAGAMDSEKPDAGVHGATTDEKASPAPPTSVMGEGAEKLKEGLINGAVSKGVDSILGNNPSAGELGKQQREFMDNAHPDLNQWEQAGANAAGAGADMATQSQNRKMQNDQLKSTEKINAANNLTSERIAQANNNTTKDVSAAQLAQTDPQVKATVNKILRETAKLDTAKGVVGTNVDDVIHLGQKYEEEIKDVLNLVSNESLKGYASDAWGGVKNVFSKAFKSKKTSPPKKPHNKRGTYN